MLELGSRSFGCISRFPSCEVSDSAERETTDCISAPNESVFDSKGDSIDAFVIAADEDAYTVHISTDPLTRDRFIRLRFLIFCTAQ